MINSDEGKYFAVIIRGEKHIIQLFHKLIINGMSYIFLGVFNKDEDVPNVSCIYIVDGLVKGKTLRRPHIPMKSPNKPIVPEVRSEGDDKLLDIKIHVEDKELMIIMKALMKVKKLTIGQFKDLFGEDPKSKADMNNYKARMENKHTLSFDKFTFLLNLLNHPYHVTIFDNE